MTDFCRHLKNGLVYNNDTTSFTVSPCCYFQGHRGNIDPTQDLNNQLSLYRTQWLSVDTGRACKICINAEDQNLPSYRQASFDIIKGVNNKIEFLTVAVNKKCNLACASCNSLSSSFWYQENTRHNVKQSLNIKQLHQEDRQGLLAERFIALLEEQDLSELRYIKFGGGEPLMSDTHERIMDLIPHPQKVTIQYTSNFSIMPSASTLEKWNKFKLIKWVASLDGVGEQFTFLRWPYRWEKLQEFAKEALTIVSGNVMFGTEHTINPLNVYYVDEFQHWFNNTLGANRYGDKSDLNIHVCTGVLGLVHTPPELRKVIKQKYGKQHPVSIALDQNPYSGSTTQLIDYLDQLDNWRGTTWRKLFRDVQGFFYG